MSALTDTTGEPSFGISVAARDGGGVTVHVCGELDLATTQTFLTAMRVRLAEGPVRLALDRLTFMDSSGVRALDTLLKEADAERWRLTVAPGFTDAVAQVLEMTGMMALLPIDTRSGT